MHALLRRHLLACTLAATLPLTALTASAAETVKVKMETTQGNIVMELYPEFAPKTVENFVQYVKDKHYDGTIFHRIINGFMIQGGGFDGQFVQKRTRPPVAHEGRESLAKGNLRNTEGTVSMARTMDPNSATAQFFINVADNTRLDPSTQSPGYTVFGKVIAGMDVVNKIKALPTGAGGPFPTDVPQTPVVILKATLEK